MKRLIYTLLVLIFLPSCYYFRAIPKQPVNLELIQQFEESGKILILVRDEMAWRFYDVKNKDSLISGKLDVEVGYHYNYLYPAEGKLIQYKKTSEPDVVNAVHIYTSDASFHWMDSTISIPVSSIYAVKSFEYAAAASRASFVAPIVLLPVIAFTAAWIYFASNFELEWSN